MRQASGKGIERAIEFADMLADVINGRGEVLSVTSSSLALGDRVEVLVRYKRPIGGGSMMNFAAVVRVKVEAIEDVPFRSAEDLRKRSL